MSSGTPPTAAYADPRGPEISKKDAQLFRQVHPNNIDKGRITRVAFEVRDSDQGLPSVHNSEKTTAEKAHQHYTGPCNRQSGGVYAVTVSECHDHELKAYEDPEPANGDIPEDPAHAAIDFRDVLKKNDKALKKAKEKALAAIADARGPVFKP